ncbi:MAG TPA: POT family MFS transporter [Planctomycetota bacterium]|nr:POT family MFS transporter [Planctomycetota bacterium]
MPPGVPYIVGNEAAERFSFYGMRTILFVFMTQYLVTSTGEDARLTETQAREWVSWFNSAAYFFPLLGALVADAFWGKYRTILYISLFYCAGHGLLALMDLPNPILQATLEPQSFLVLGLLLIAIGAGGIKPCVSANVGDQFGATNAHLLPRVFGWFYFSINVGSFASTLLTPWLLEHHGPGWAFGVPGILMAVATFTFWLGRRKFVHIPPGGKQFVRQTLSGEGLRVIGKLVPLYLFVAVFWALYDQSGAGWVGQAAQMDRSFLGIVWLESQVQAINPLLILLFIPLFTYVVYPAIDRVWKLTPLRKLGIGFFTTAASFALTAVVQSWIDDGATPSIAWQLLAFVILTAAEVMVSITCLEFSYTQAPPRMKSFVMALFFLSVSLGNVFTALVNRFTMDAEGNSTLVGASYYWFFTTTMLVAAVVYVGFSLWFKPRTYLQQEAA